MNRQTRVAIYGRVSRHEQSGAMQFAELREHCKARGWLIAKEYFDKGISGAQDTRPELNRLMQDAQHRRIDIVAVWKFDRLARSVTHLLKALETFRSLGIEFISLSEQIDTSTPAEKMVFTVLGAVAELERALIGERVKAGLRNAKANGKKLGRPPLRQFSKTDVRRLRMERRCGVSYKKLAQNYGTSVWTAFRLCRNGAA